MALFGNSWAFDLLVFFISTFTLAYWFVKHKYTYWDRMGFKSYPNPTFLLGHFGPALSQKMGIGELITHMYRDVEESFIGIYGFIWPFLLVRDPQAVRNILIRDFQYFTDRTYKRIEHLQFTFVDFQITFLP